MVGMRFLDSDYADPFFSSRSGSPSSCGLDCYESTIDEFGALFTSGNIPSTIPEYEADPDGTASAETFIIHGSADRDHVLGKPDATALALHMPNQIRSEARCHYQRKLQASGWWALPVQKSNQPILKC